MFLTKEKCIATVKALSDKELTKLYEGAFAQVKIVANMNDSESQFIKKMFDLISDEMTERGL
jgi:hypothetical protein